jgi:hypothetical protein
LPNEEFLIDAEALLRPQYKARIRPIMLLFPHDTQLVNGAGAAKRPDNEGMIIPKRPGKARPLITPTFM